MGIGVLFGDDGFFDVVREFIADSANAIPDVLGSDIDIAVEFKFNCDTADLLPRFTAEDFNSRDIINFLFHGFGDIGFDKFSIGTRVDGDDGDDGRVDVRELADGKAGEGNDADEGNRQISHGGGHGAPNTKLRKIHGAGGVEDWGVEGVSGRSLRPGERRRLPERATRSPARSPLRISIRPGMRRPISMGTSSATPSASR